MVSDMVAIEVAVAISVAAIGTGYAQAKIGTAGAAKIAERPDSTGAAIIILAIPETMVVLGFVVAILLLFT